ncbi:flagellin [Acidobacteria bacterium AB60]|nr:flagellin [Acidobacteria bacterium AB60]
MSLGVLNNLSAMYAANNLSNTQNSLSKTLQQLSSGSKINSGADDAAGLSLINGLQANATALSQSQTNAAEGVGLLQVADGALSQVTNLLNRAVTLATEVSNGTLNSSQQSAANQEYQSILSEISNIGSTTTYNQKTVFGNTGANAFNIYVGDSSSTGASIDSLSIGALSSGSVGETNGTMSYNNAKSVVVDLGSLAANTNTAFNGAGASTLTFSNATGTVTTVNLSAAENVGNVIQAINNANIGVTASFVAGNAATATNAQLVISGDIETGAAPSGAEVRVAVATGALAGGLVFANGTNGTAEITYSASAGVDLSSTGLTTQANAQNALTRLNSAISAVAAQDGYIGAQINTLNAVSSVMNTQQQNIVAAQNAVQATDYATASSNMAKFQILSQTGISALAQANSIQQLVTKLLQ